jgi:disulfide bond formation protein DsbB
MKSIKSIYTFALLTSILSLVAALTAQYAFGLKPCELCQLQRIPYGLVIIVSFIGLMRKKSSKSTIYLIIFIFASGGALASYHASVEKHWIAGPSGCTVTPTVGEQSLDDFLQKIQKAPIVACDQPAWDFHGITMAIMNAFWSLLLALCIYVAMQQYWGKNYA